MKMNDEIIDVLVTAACETNGIGPEPRRLRMTFAGNGDEREVLRYAQDDKTLRMTKHSG